MNRIRKRNRRRQNARRAEGTLKTGAKSSGVRPSLPPNENVRKHPDEVYGDTEIPARR